MLNLVRFNIAGGPKPDVFLISFRGSFSKPITPLRGRIRNTLRFNPPLWKADGLGPRLCLFANLINPSWQARSSVAYEVLWDACNHLLRSTNDSWPNQAGVVRPNQGIKSCELRLIKYQFIWFPTTPYPIIYAFDEKMVFIRQKATLTRRLWFHKR